MLRKVAFNKFYLHRLWKNICQLKTGDPTSSKNEIYYLQVLVSGKYKHTDFVRSLSAQARQLRPV